MNKLRLGFILDSYIIPVWTHALIEQIVHSAFAEAALLIIIPAHPNKYSVFVRQRSRWLYRVFNFIDERLFIRGSNALALIDSYKIFSKVPVLELNPIGDYDKQVFSAVDIQQIKSYHLDVLVKLSCGKLHGEILSAATYGIWTYRWGDHHKIEDGLTGFWEVVSGWPETGVSLQQLGINHEHNQILFESWLFTYPFSPARNRNYIMWAASSFLPREVERLHSLGREQYFQGLKEKNRGNEAPRSLKSNGIPSNAIALGIMMKLAVRNVLEVYRRSFHQEQWGLLFNLGNNVGQDFVTFKTIFPSKDRFWADPHVIYRDPYYYIFVEEYLYASRKGHISVIEMDQNGNFKPPVPILQKAYHLSYPFVFEWMDKLYMIPETADNCTIDLYECIDFPYQWQFKMNLMKDIKAVDTTVFCHQGRWWLFTALAENKEAFPQVELFLFSSPELFSNQWHAHPSNPIVSDVKSARPAGRIFQRNGKIFRPSQYCSSRYGYGFNLNEIVTLSPNEYVENCIVSVKPDWDRSLHATHTYWSDEKLTVIDVLTKRRRWI